MVLEAQTSAYNMFLPRAVCLRIGSVSLSCSYGLHNPLCSLSLHRPSRKIIMRQSQTRPQDVLISLKPRRPFIPVKDHWQHCLSCTALCTGSQFIIMIRQHTRQHISKGQPDVSVITAITNKALQLVTTKSVSQDQAMLMNLVFAGAVTPEKKRGT